MGIQQPLGRYAQLYQANMVLDDLPIEISIEIIMKQIKLQLHDQTTHQSFHRPMPLLSLRDLRPAALKAQLG